MSKIILIFLLGITTTFYAQKPMYIKHWSNGLKGIEGGYDTEGKKDGLWQKWNNKGELTGVIIYKGGSVDSKTTHDYYTDTDSLLYESKYYNSKKNLIEHRVYTKKNNETYRITHFHENGKKKSVGNILNGKKDGKWKFYNEKGSFIESVYFKEKNPEENFIKSEIKANYNPEKDRSIAGYYINKKGDKITGFFQEGSFLSPKLKFKIAPNRKPYKLDYSNILSYKYDTNSYVVIANIKIRRCNLLGLYDKNKPAKILIEGKINLYSTYVNCNSGGYMGPNGVMMAGVSYSEEVFIIKKGRNGEFKEVREGNRKFRELIRELMQDNRTVMSEIDFKTFNSTYLIPTIKRYNSFYE